MEVFHPQTFVKFVPLNRTCKRFTYNLGLNVDIHPFNSSSTEYTIGGLYYTDIENIHSFEYEGYGDHIMIVKVPVEVPIVKLVSEPVKYKSPSIFVESIHLYKDFLNDDTILTDLKKSMKRVDIRMPLHQTKENCLEAVKKDGYTIKYILSSSMVEKLLDIDTLKEICLESVKKNGYTIQYILSSSAVEKLFDNEFLKEICLESVKNNNGYAISYILSSPIAKKLLDNDFLKKICLEAVKKDGYTIKYILSSSMAEKLFDNEFLKEICLESVKNNNGYAISYILSSPIAKKLLDNDFLKKICLAAVKQDGTVIRYVNEEFLDKEICLTALKQNLLAIKYFRDKFIMQNFHIEFKH